jgi:hypothetical protein
MNKKAQMEILGLAIIVVLIMFGVLFALRFVLNQDDSNLLDSFKESELATSMLTTMMSTTSSCNQATVKTLIQDCGRPVPSLQCGNRNSCEEAEFILNDMLTGTLGKWNRNYYFTINDNQDTTRIELGEPCSGQQEFSTEPIVITAGITWRASIALCR